MEVRRVVAGTDASGRSVFLSDSATPHAHTFQHLPGQGFARLWQSAPDSTTAIPDGDTTTLTGPLLPEPGATSFMVVQYAPDTVFLSPTFDPAAAGTEFVSYVPDLAAAMEPDAPGMHRTESIDFGVVLDGEIWLELDDGAETRLTAGDTIVQLGARHAWRNKSDRPATVAFVMLGAKRG